MHTEIVCLENREVDKVKKKVFSLNPSVESMLELSLQGRSRRIWEGLVSWRHFGSQTTNSQVRHATWISPAPWTPTRWRPRAAEKMCSRKRGIILFWPAQLFYSPRPLAGHIPPELGALSELQTLGFGGNKLTGTYCVCSIIGGIKVFLSSCCG